MKHWHLCLLASLLATAGLAFPAPQVEVGTFELVSSNNPEWTSDFYTQLADGSFTGYGSGTWEGPPDYTYFGSITQASCMKLPNGNLAVMQQWWFHDEVFYENEDDARVACTYKEWSDTSPPTIVSRAEFRDNAFRSVAELRNGIFPGACPITVAEARAGIAWMEEIAPDNGAMFRCSGECGAFGCVGGFAVPAPQVVVGTFELQLPTSDPDWTSETYQQLADGSFTGYGSGTWGGSPADYTYFGNLVQASCTKLPNGNLAVMEQMWLHDTWTSPGVALVSCLYRIFGDSSPPTVVDRAWFRGANQHSMDELREGKLPGACPATVAEARAGIAWMGEIAPDTNNAMYRCSADCGAFGCESEGEEPVTCADVKKAFKESGCCGNPGAPFRADRMGRRLGSAEGRPESEVFLREVQDALRRAVVTGGQEKRERLKREILAVLP